LPPLTVGWAWLGPWALGLRGSVCRGTLGGGCPLGPGGPLPGPPGPEGALCPSWGCLLVGSGLGPLGSFWPLSWPVSAVSRPFWALFGLFGPVSGPLILCLGAFGRVPGLLFWPGFGLFLGPVFGPLGSLWVSGPQTPALRAKTRLPRPLGPPGLKFPVSGVFRGVLGGFRPVFRCFGPPARKCLRGPSGPKWALPVLAPFGVGLASFLPVFGVGFRALLARTWGSGPCFWPSARNPVLGPQKGPFSGCFRLFSGPSARKPLFWALQQGRLGPPFGALLGPLFRVFSGRFGPFGPPGPFLALPGPWLGWFSRVLALFGLFSGPFGLLHPVSGFTARWFWALRALFGLVSPGPSGPGKTRRPVAYPRPSGPKCTTFASFGALRAPNRPKTGPDPPGSLGFSTFLASFVGPSARQKRPKTSRNQGSLAGPRPVLGLLAPRAPKGPWGPPQGPVLGPFRPFGPFLAPRGPCVGLCGPFGAQNKGTSGPAVSPVFRGFGRFRPPPGAKYRTAHLKRAFVCRLKAHFGPNPD